MVDDFGLEELAMEAERHQFALDPEGLRDVSGKTGIVYGWHEMEGKRDLIQTLERAIKARG